MSLWWNRRTIVAAVAGELSAADDARLRKHLASCDACRARYDELKAVKHALQGGIAQSEHDQALDRLLGALDGAAPARAERVAPSWRWLAVPALAVLLALGVWQLRPSDVTMRGTGDDAPLRNRFSLYAKPQVGTEPVRLVGEVPSSGALRVHATDWLQIRVTGDAGVVVAVHDTLPPALLEVGSSQALGPGRWRLHFLSSDGATALQAAQRQTPELERLPSSAWQASALLSVDP